MNGLNDKRIIELNKIQESINYSFKDIQLLNNALTHSSYINGKTEQIQYNERLEFLGDSVLSIIISVYLFQKCPSLSEGQLTRVRANIVCEQSLHKAAVKISLGDYILMSKGEINTGGRKRASILADAFEALIASIYLDRGLKKARHFVLSNLKDIIKDSINNKIFNDYKSYLQEFVQKDNLGEIKYKLISDSGPDHNKQFEMGICLNDQMIGTGIGHSKKDAQQEAAKNAIESMGIKYEG